jgi:DNA polymerase I-like protein with 3'-5' exonuclease and polymerase domains
VVTAYFANEKNMLNVCRTGKSPHVYTGQTIFEVPEKLIMAEHKMLGNSVGEDIVAEARKKIPELAAFKFLPRTMSVRLASKKANHGLNYRLGYKTHALNNEIAESESKRIVDMYRTKTYPGLQNDWYPWIDRTVRDTRTLTNCFGRTVYFQGALDDETFRDATAFVPQSTVFDVTRVAKTKMFENDSADFAPAEPLAQVHDSLLTQYLSHDFKAMARYAIKLGLDYLSPTLQYNDMDFTLSVELKVGRNWGQLEEIKLTPDPDALALELERVYDKSYPAR